MIIIGLTGSISSGKSLVTNFIRDENVPVIDADEIAKQIVEPGRECWHKIVEYFGKQILNDDLKIDRKLLSSLIFNNTKNKEQLNQITHPIIEKVMKTKIELYKHQEQQIIFLDVPLLIETNMNYLVDIIWLVYVDEIIQIQRLMARNNLSLIEALDRIKSQMSFEEKKKYANLIIDNSESRENTRKQVLIALKELRLKK